MPNEGINTLERENDDLREEIAKEREDWMNKLDSLRESLQIKEARISETNNEEARIAGAMTKKAQELERQHLDLTKELFALKISTNERERRLQEENELMRLKNTALANKLLIVEKQGQAGS